MPRFLRNESIDDSKIVGKTGDDLVKTGRLSIRKRTPVGDENYVPKHNQKYFRKFDKEYLRLNPTQEKVSAGASDDDMTPIVSIPLRPKENLKLHFWKIRSISLW